MTILLPYRDREFERVHAVLFSLKDQMSSSVEVILIEYGSSSSNISRIEKLTKDFPFLHIAKVAHRGLLWCKARALNHGIRLSNSDFILTSDIDVVFHHEFISRITKILDQKVFTLFRIGYLSNSFKPNDVFTTPFNQRPVTHVHNTYGIGLYPRKALIDVGGVDTFFHFYGSEDEDLNARVSRRGYLCHFHEDLLMQHIWHPRYPAKGKEPLTVSPRLSNILRINQRHYLRNTELGVIQPSSSIPLGRVWKPEDLQVMENPQYEVGIYNIAAHVDHFLEVELPACKGVVRLSVTIDPWTQSWRYRVKKALGYHEGYHLSMKEVNDRILRHILFKYRDRNYDYKVYPTLDRIDWTIDLDKCLV